MSLHWTIYPERKLMTATAVGDVTREEFEAYLEAVEAAGANSYSKLFDGSQARASMTPEDVLELGRRMRATHATGPMGALAVVVPSELVEPFDRLLGMLAAAERPMRVFRQTAPAHKWIASLPVSPTSGEAPARQPH